MRIVFMGTPLFAARILSALCDKHEVIACYTRADAVRGRGKKLIPSPVKEEAQSRGIPVFTPPSFKDPKTVEQLAELQPEVICVAAYGALLPPEVLAIPPFGCLNVHGSLLPRWRGAAPLERALLAGDETTGVCIMAMEAGLDTGPYCQRGTIEIGEKDLAALYDEMAQLGSDLLLQALDGLQANEVQWQAQNEVEALYAQKIGKGELNPTPNDAPSAFIRKVRASSTEHPAKAMLAFKPVTLETCRLLDAESEGTLASGLEPGTLRFAAKRLLLGLPGGAVEVLSLKPDGKKSMTGAAFAAGIPGMKTEDNRWDAL